MKKLFLIALVLALPCLCYGQAALPVGNVVVAGGNEWIGYTDTTGAASYQDATGTIICTGPFTPTHNGTISKIQMYSSNAVTDLDMKWGLYSDTAGVPSAKEATEVTFTDVGSWSLEWHEFSSGIEFPVVTSKAYWLCYSISASPSIYEYYTTGTGNKYYSKDNAWIVGWLDPYTDQTHAASQLLIKAYSSW